MTDAQKALDEYPLLKNGEIAGSMACWTYLHRNGETIRAALTNASIKGLSHDPHKGD